MWVARLGRMKVVNPGIELSLEDTRHIYSAPYRDGPAVRALDKGVISKVVAECFIEPDQSKGAPTIVFPQTRMYPHDFAWTIDALMPWIYDIRTRHHAWTNASTLSETQWYPQRSKNIAAIGKYKLTNATETRRPSLHSWTLSLYTFTIST